MNSKKNLSLVLLAAIGLFGCATPFQAPPEVRNITLSRGHSPVVIVEKIWLERTHGDLVVTGSVLKRLGVMDTTGTHLDVTLFDSGEKIVRSTVEHFEPAQIRRRWRRSPIANYRVRLEPLPANVSRIEVRAHEGAHPATS